jgi:hypothetical protein
MGNILNSLIKFGNDNSNMSYKQLEQELINKISSLSKNNFENLCDEEKETITKWFVELILANTRNNALSHDLDELGNILNQIN